MKSNDFDIYLLFFLLQVIRFIIKHRDSFQHLNSVKSSSLQASKYLDYRRLPKRPADRIRIYEYFKY